MPQPESTPRRVSPWPAAVRRAALAVTLLSGGCQDTDDGARAVGGHYNYAVRSHCEHYSVHGGALTLGRRYQERLEDGVLHTRSEYFLDTDCRTASDTLLIADQLASATFDLRHADEPIQTPVGEALAVQLSWRSLRLVDGRRLAGAALVRHFEQAGIPRLSHTIIHRIGDQVYLGASGQHGDTTGDSVALRPDRLSEDWLPASPDRARAGGQSRAPSCPTRPGGCGLGRAQWQRWYGSDGG